MKPWTTLLAASFLPFAACSGGGADVPTPARVQHGDSTGTPLPGSTVGNWKLLSISVIQDTGAPHSMQTGMNLRVSKVGLEVLLDEYVGPGSMLPNLLENFYGGEYTVREFNDPERGFEISLTLDFSPFFGAKSGSFYNSIYAKGTLVGEALEVEYLFRQFLLLDTGVQEVGRDELSLSFGKGQPVKMAEGAWEVSKVLVLADTAPATPLLFPAPIPKRVAVGDKLVIGKAEVTSLFGGPVNKDEFNKVFPDFGLKFQDGFVGNAAAQGFMAIEGEPGLKYDNQGAVIEYNFFQTNGMLVGDLQGAWAADLGKGPTHLYHIYVELTQGVGMPQSLGSPSSGGSSSGGLYLGSKLGSEADRVDDLDADIFGVWDPDALRGLVASGSVTVK
jgi:hypothetical protein